MKSVYKCDFCNYMGPAEDVEAHEKVCKYNPAVRHCYTCVHCTIEPGYFGYLADPAECNLDGVTRDGLDCAAYEQGQPMKIIAV